MDTGITMLVRAMGIDPKAVVAKGEELERLAKLLAIQLHEKVSLIDDRLTNIESMLEDVAEIKTLVIHLLETSRRMESVQAGVTPVGESTVDVTQPFYITEG